MMTLLTDHKCPALQYTTGENCHEHMISTIYTDFATTYKYQCCHCAKERIEEVRNSGTIYGPEKHSCGPYAPKFTTLLSKGTPCA